MKNNKTNKPLHVDGLWRQHRNKQQSRVYWSKERQYVVKSIEEELKDLEDFKESKDGEW